MAHRLYDDAYHSMTYTRLSPVDGALILLTSSHSNLE